jgi:hypothetical protein
MEFLLKTLPVTKKQEQKHKCFPKNQKTIKRESSATKHAVLPNLFLKHINLESRQSASRNSQAYKVVTRKSPTAKAVIKTKWTLSVETRKYYRGTTVPVVVGPKSC